MLILIIFIKHKVFPVYCRQAPILPRVPHFSRKYTEIRQRIIISIPTIKAAPERDSLLYPLIKSSKTDNARADSLSFFSFFFTLSGKGGSKPKFTFIGWKSFPMK